MSLCQWTVQFSQQRLPSSCRFFLCLFSVTQFLSFHSPSPFLFDPLQRLHPSAGLFLILHFLFSLVLSFLWRVRFDLLYFTFPNVSLPSSPPPNPCLPPPSGPNRSKLQDMLANLRDAEELPSMQPPVMPPSRPSVPRLNEHEVGRPEDGNLPPPQFARP